MTLTEPKEPTAEQCTAHAALGHGWYACWYPQMGGYVGKAAIYPGTTLGGCFEALVWHDGEFPFSEDGEYTRPPAHLHHCNAEQFRVFADEVTAMQEEHAVSDADTVGPRMSES